MTSIAIINTAAPFGTSSGQESLDLVLAAGSFGQSVSVIFMFDAVFQLLKNQQPENIDAKNYSKTFAALEFYDVEDIYVCADSLVQRGLTAQDLCINAQVVSPEALRNILSAHAHTLRF